ncbi:hypothetical protein D9M68_662460 [compost metagenome]
MLLIREDFVLHRQVYTCTIYDVDHRQPVFHRDLLQAQVFLTRNREPGSGFNGIVIGNDHTLTATYITDTGYRTTGRTTTMLRVHLITGKNTQLQEVRVFISQVFDTLTRRHFAFGFSFFNCFLSTTLFNHCFTLSHLAGDQAHGIFIFIEF